MHVRHHALISILGMENRHDSVKRKQIIQREKEPPFILCTKNGASWI